MNCGNSSKSPKPDREGLTLVEVVAALLLAATVLGTVLVAYGRGVRQERIATDRLTAVQVADELLAEWYAPGGTVPLPDHRLRTPTTGQVEGHDTWHWRVSALPADSRPTRETPFSVRRYRLDIITVADPQRPERSLVAVEFVGSIMPVAAGPLAGVTQ